MTDPSKRERLKAILSNRFLLAALATKEVTGHVWDYLKALREVVRPINLHDDRR